MTGIGGLQIASDDPRLWAAAVGLLLFLILWRTGARAGAGGGAAGAAPRAISTARCGR